MFDAMADWMAVPLLQQEAGAPPQRVGLAHTSIAPYGAFRSRDGIDILISIQSDREWRILAERVLGDAALAADPAFATNVERVKRRSETDGRVAAVFGALDAAALEEKLAAADIAFARVNSPAELGIIRICAASLSGRQAGRYRIRRRPSSMHRRRGAMDLSRRSARILKRYARNSCRRQYPDVMAPG